MSITQIDDQYFENINYSNTSLIRHHFCNCVFTNCNFTNTDISYTDFEDCTFNICNFSQTIVNTTGLKNAIFTDSKLLGFKFNHCKDFLFEVSFKNCQLDYASFYQKKMKKTNFSDCSMKDVDFTETDLTSAVFHNCDLQDAFFMDAVLESVNFASAIHFIIDPEKNNIKNATFSYEGLLGLLSKYTIQVQI